MNILSKLLIGMNSDTISLHSKMSLSTRANFKWENHQTISKWDCLITSWFPKNSSTT